MSNSSSKRNSLQYIPNTDEDRKQMLDAIGEDSIESILQHQIPEHARLKRSLCVPKALSEMDLIAHARGLASKNADADEYVTFLGAGIYDHFIPSAVMEIMSRGEFYTAYTPYQAELSQGTLQSIYEYQTLISQLTGMDVSNASMYDGASALAEAAAMAFGINGRKKIIVSSTVHPTHREVLRTYVSGLPLDIIEAPYEDGITDVEALKKLITDDTSAVLVQHPNFFGMLEPVIEIEELAHKAGAAYVVSVDPISLGMLKPPGEYNADIVVGEGQSLGNQMSYGGPILGIFASKKEYIRRLPGRLVGATVDKQGNRSYCLTLQTREQHIRREHATSNICTNQALMALGAAAYLSLMGRHGMQKVADLCYRKSHYAVDSLKRGGLCPKWHGPFFKEFVLKLHDIDINEMNDRLLDKKVIGGLPLGTYYKELSDCVLLAVTEQRTRVQIDNLAKIMSEVAHHARGGVRYRC